MTDTSASHDGPQVPIGADLEEIFDLAYEVRSPLMLEGETGIGKSEFVLAVADRLEIDVAVINLALFEGPGELIGLPGVQDGRTVYALPSFLPTEGRGIIVFEELNRAPAYILAAIYELMTSRTLGTYRLPDGWMVVCCINPAGTCYHVGHLDKAMLDRFLRIGATADRMAWARWAEEHGVHPALVAIAREDSRLFAIESPRTWVKASQYLLAAEREGTRTFILELVLGSLLSSPEVAQAVLRRLDDAGEEETIQPLDILSRYAWDEELTERVQQLEREGRTDVLEKLAHDVEEIVGGRRLTVMGQIGSFDIDSFEDFLEELPGDRRDDLRQALASNPASATVLDVDPTQAFDGYDESLLAQSVDDWKSIGVPHRLDALGHKVAQELARLDASGSLHDERKRHQLQRSLIEFIEDVGVAHATPLLRQMDALGLEHGLSETL